MTTTSTSEAPPERDKWVRWLPVWYSIFYILLASCMFIALTEDLAQREQLAIVSLTILLAGWYGYSIRSQPETMIDNPLWANALYFLSGWAIWFVLVAISPVFLFMLFTLHPHVFIFVRLQRAIAGSFLLSLLSTIHMGLFDDVGGLTLIIWVLMGTAIAGVLGYFIKDIIEQSYERRDLIVKLEQTQHSLVQAERQAGILQERGRLAGEIHDTLAQGFISIVMHLEAIDNAVSTEKITLAPTVAKHLLQAKQVARENLTEARRVVWGLRPDILESLSFEDAIREIVHKWSEKYTIPKTFTITGDSYALSEEQQVVVLRIVQEALTNIHKHASATEISVTLSYTKSTVMLDIWDNGVGFIPKDASTKRGYGLISMRERAQSLGGEITIESEVGEGTTVAVQLPRIYQSEQITHERVTNPNPHLDR